MEFGICENDIWNVYIGKLIVLPFESINKTMVLVIFWFWSFKTDCLGIWENDIWKFGMYTSVKDSASGAACIFCNNFTSLICF